MQAIYKDILLPPQIDAIREAAALGVSQALIGAIAGISQATVNAVLNGKRYAHVKPASFR